MGKQSDIIFWGSKITADGDCRKAMTNLDDWVEKQRNYSANKAPYCQGYALPELYHKQDRVPKN